MNVSKMKCCVCLAIALVLNAMWISPAVAWPEEGRAAITPSLAKIAPGESQQFHATQLPRRMQVARPATNVVWSVNGVPGGNDTIGRIDTAGLYQAPDSTPDSSVVHIGASVPDATNQALYATLLLAKTPGYRSESHWPEEQIQKAGLKVPTRILLDAEGVFIVLDAATGKMGRFTKDGEYLDNFGKNAEGKAFGGVSMAALSPYNGQVYTGDLATGPPRINVFNADGEWLLGLGQKGSRPGMMMVAKGVAFHPDGRIYVADMDAMRVSIFDADHAFLRFLRNHAPAGNRTNAPSDVAIDAAGDLFVASTYGPCEKVSADTGERLLAFAYPLPPKGMMYIDDVCLDRWGDVYLAVRSGADLVDSGPDHGGVASILKYTNAGDYVTTITLSATAPTRVSVAVDADGRLYAAYTTAVTKIAEEMKVPDASEVTAGIEVFVQE